MLVGDKGVGTFGGSEDHTAIMSGEYMKLKMFSYCPTRYEGEFKFPEKYGLVAVLQTLHVVVLSVCRSQRHRTDIN